MRSPFVGGAPRLLPSLLLPLLVAGCQSEPRAARDRVSCDRIPGYERYVDELATHAARSSDAEIAKLDRGERVVLSVWLRGNGSLEKVRARSSTSPAIRELGLRAAREAAPYPAPPASLRGCIVGRRAEFMLFSMGPPCDLARAEAYVDHLTRLIWAPLSSEESLRAPGSGRVSLRLDLDPSGELLAVEVAQAESEAAAEKARRAVREAAPFPVPDPSYRECLPDPLLFWFVVPGSSP